VGVNRIGTCRAGSTKPGRSRSCNPGDGNYRPRARPEFDIRREVGTLPNYLRIRRESGFCNRIGPRKIGDWRMAVAD